MDWVESTDSSLYVFPAGMSRHGYAGKRSLTWQSQYGSVVTTMDELITVDGVNSEGLAGSVLYVADADYGDRDTSRPGLSIGLWLQYFLDLYPSISSVTADLFTRSGQEKFQLVTKDIVPGILALGHVSLTDATGDNLIMKYIDGRLKIHHSHRHAVVTDEPSYREQLAISAYWKPIANFSLPGTARPADCFARLAHYVDVGPKSKDMVSAVATAMGMIRAVSVPLEPTNINTPNVAPTRWRRYVDTKDLRYFFESATEPSTLWVGLTDLDLSSRGHVLRLNLDGRWEERVGDISAKFLPSPPFQPLEVSDSESRGLGDDGGLFQSVFLDL